MQSSSSEQIFLTLKMQKNIAYGYAVETNGILENTYDQPGLTPATKEAVIVSTPKPNIRSRKALLFNIFVTIFSTFVLILALTCFIFILAHFLLNQPLEAQQNLAVETLQSYAQSVKQELSGKLLKLNDKLLRLTIHPTNSCQHLPSGSSSGYYHVATSSGVTHVYCNTNLKSCSCNTTGAWMRVANIDMTDPTQDCPKDFRLIQRTRPPLRTCGRPNDRCVSTTFPVHGIPYSRICGKIVGYQLGLPEAFQQGRSIDDQYVAGVSLTHGQSPRQHIWTFVNARTEGFNNNDFDICPCTRNNSVYTGTLPSFMGEDYFCDTAIRDDDIALTGHFYSNDPLWDGQGCGDVSTCCEFNSPPWFCRQLPQPTTDDIELRLCETALPIQEDSPFETVEIYVN